MFDDLIAEVFAKGPQGGPGGSCRGLEGAHTLISGDWGGRQGVLGRSWGGRRAPSGAAGGQEAMDLIALGVPFLAFLLCF